MATATKAKKKISIQPLGDRILVERESSEEKTSGGIFFPDTAKNKPARRTVLSVGGGVLLKDGKRSPLQLKAGDKVIFTSYGPEEMKIHDREYLLMRESDVLAVIE